MSGFTRIFWAVTQKFPQADGAWNEGGKGIDTGFKIFDAGWIGKKTGKPQH